MQARSPTVSLCLDQAPVINQAGLSQHGFSNRQTFELHGLYGLHFYQYAGTLEIGDQQVEFLPDEVTLTPPDTRLTWTFPKTAPHYYIHFSANGQVPETFPVKFASSRPPKEILADFEYIGTQYERNPLRAAVRLWDLLFKLQDEPQQHPETGTGSTAVQIATSEITNHLHKPLRVAELARLSGVSPNYLTRVFHKAHGCSPVQYIIRQRIAKARFLITETSVPLKSIAATIGIPDLQHFNKFIRKHFGCGPRELRESGQRQQ